jgi:hypothetical protein
MLSVLSILRVEYTQYPIPRNIKLFGAFLPQTSSPDLRSSPSLSGLCITNPLSYHPAATPDNISLRI